MRLWKKRDEDIFDYLDSKVDRAKLQSCCSHEINEINFLKLAVYIVSTYIATAISTCEFKVYNSDGLIKDINYYKLNVSPNPNDTGTKLKYKMVKELVQNGESLVVQYKNNLYFAEYFGYASESILGYEFDNVTIQNEPIAKEFNRKTSFYFSFDDEKVKSLLDTIDVKYKELLSCATKVYKNSLSNKWKLKIDTAKQNDPTFEEEFNDFVTSQLKEFLTSDEGVYPELNGYNLERLEKTDSKSDSSDIRNIRKDIFDMVSQSYKMPVSMMYGNVTNLKEVINQFITFAVKPYASLIGEEITRTLYTEQEILDGNRVEVDISSINYKDIFDIANGIDKLISTGIANIDETRKMVNLPVLDTEFSKQYWMTKNYSKIEEAVQEQLVPNSSSNESNNNSEYSNLEGGDVHEKK